jgi:hypothetical protein
VVNASQPGVLARRAASRQGYEQISSLEGGWSFEIPTGWTASSTPVRGAEIASFDLGAAQFSGNAPAADQLRIRVQVMPDYDATALEIMGARDVPSWLVVAQTHAIVSGQDAVRTVKNAYVPAGTPFDQQHVVWTFRSPFLANRVLVVDAWPADGSLRAAADHAIATFQLAQPKWTQSVPISRQQAIDGATQYLRATGRVDRVAAKLVNYHEYVVASNSGYSYTQDPEDLVWIVVTGGEFLSTHSRPPSTGPVPPDRLIVQVLGSSTGLPFSGMYSPQDTWPAWFDGLKDRAP